MALLHWETLYCPNRHGQGDGQPHKTGRVVQHSSSHSALQAQGNRCGWREALRNGTAYDGLEADRTIVESAGAHLDGRKCATCHDADRAGGT